MDTVIRYRTGYAEGGNIVWPLLRDRAGVLAHRLHNNECSGQAGKGVIGPIEVVDESMMPFDPVTGERAEIVISPETTNNRINYGRWWEQGINASRAELERQLFNLLQIDKSKGAIREQLRRVPSNVCKQAFDLIQSFLAMGFVKQHEWYKGLSYEEKFTDLYHVLNDKMYLYKPTDNPVPSAYILKEAKAKGFLPSPRTLKYWDKKDKAFKDTKYQTIIGSLYYICLEKTGSDWAAVAVSSTQPNGIIATLTTREKAISQVRRQATRFPEEASIRSFVASTDTGFAVEIHDRSNNPEAAKAIVETIYNAPEPTNVKHIIDRDKIPLGGSRPRKIMRNVMQCEGIAFQYNEFDPSQQARAEIDPITGTLAAMTVEEDPEDKKTRTNRRNKVEVDNDDDEELKDALDELIDSEVEEDDDDD